MADKDMVRTLSHVGARTRAGRGNFPMGPVRNKSLRTQPTGPVLKVAQIWQNWNELTIHVSQLASSTTTLDLWDRFSREGNIAYIAIHENRGVRKDSATVRFCPPPKNDFWTGKTVSLSSPDGSGYVIQVQPLPQRRSGKVQSPIQKTVFYPEYIDLSPRSLGFGIMFSENTMMVKRELEAPSSESLKLRVDLMRKKIVANFAVAHKDPETQTPVHIRYRFQVPFAQLSVIHRLDVDEKRWALILSLDSPPQFFVQHPKISATHQKQALSWSEFDSWIRLTEIYDGITDLRSTPISLTRTNPIIDLGRWNTYMLVFEKDDVRPDEYETMKSALHDFNIDVINVQDFKTIPNAPVKIWDMLDAPKSNEDRDDLHYLMENSDSSMDFPFDVRYQFEVCISRNILEQQNITPEFIKALAALTSENREKAKFMLEYVAEQGKRIYDPLSIFSNPDALTHSPRSTIPSYCAYSRKATITTTTMYFSSPTVEISNRVIRKYSAYEDRFLRVQFTDELFEGRLSPCADKNQNDRVFSKVYRTLKNGIRIGDRLFEFLAFGNSQFRENGAYFFCPTEDLSCAQIRNWMGNFRDIKVVAKYAARLGLCFSTTRAIRNSGMKIVEIPDVERNGYNFTDGVGKVSPFLIKMIATELHLPSEPSVIQFRMGGCKGVLAISDDARGQEVHIRKSQTKFTAEYMGLEIIKWSSFSVATLNRQTITILSSLGVEDDVFNRMLENQLASYSEAVTDSDKAKELLAMFIDDNHMTIVLATMIINGFMESEEPFFLSCLHLWRSWSIKLLKEKARIIVERGAFVLGCTDETQTLRGHTDDAKIGMGRIMPHDIERLPQIFLQVTDRNDPKHHTVIEGLCLVGRNPSLHPGDIRVVQAIDVPKLHHLRDVVVFSQQGDRDVPSMCSGGDLDGDDFFVIWDQDLIPREWNAPPMNYASPTPVTLDRPVKIDDVTSFFVRYMKSDSLGTIAHAHLAQSDYLDMSAKDQKCLELASLHSKAVDFVKTGIPAEMPKSLRPRQWPHFMEKNHKPKEQIYRSEKVLGQLYDKVESVDFHPQYEKQFDSRILKAYDLDRDLLKTARQIKTKYDTAMKRIMAQHEIQTEFEVWTSFVLSKPRVGSDYKVQEEMGLISSALKERFKEICIEEAGSKEFSTLAPFVAAMYKVTWEELRIALHECKTTKVVRGREVPKRKMEPKSMPFISFPWLFDGILGKIATNVELGGLESIDLPLLDHRDARPKKQRVAVSDENIAEDFIETADGVTHRGEVLDLFRPDPVDSEDEEEYTNEYHDDLATIQYGGNDNDAERESPPEKDSSPKSPPEKGSSPISRDENASVSKLLNGMDLSALSSVLPALSSAVNKSLFPDKRESVASPQVDLLEMKNTVAPPSFDLANLAISKELDAPFDDFGRDTDLSQDPVVLTCMPHCDSPSPIELEKNEGSREGIEHTAVPPSSELAKLDISEEPTPLIDAFDSIGIESRDHIVQDGTPDRGSSTSVESTESQSYQEEMNNGCTAGQETQMPQLGHGQGSTQSSPTVVDEDSERNTRVGPLENSPVRSGADEAGEESDGGGEVITLDVMESEYDRLQKLLAPRK